MNHTLAVSKAQFLDKKLDSLVADMFSIAITFDQLDLLNLGTDFRTKAEKYRMLQLVISKAFAKEFQRSAMTGEPWVSPKLIDDFIPERMEIHGD